jgi:hypothetical protein
MSKRLSIGEEVGTMQIRVLGEIKMNKMRGEKKIQSTSRVKKKKRKKGRKQEKEK